MDFGAVDTFIPVIVIVAVLLLLQYFVMRRRKPEKTQQEIVRNLLLEVRVNLAMVETFHLMKKPKGFMITSWHMTKNKLDFLAQPLQVALSDAYMVIEDFNQQISAARKYKSASYMVNVDVDKLREPLARSKEGLEKWLLSTTGSKEPELEYPSVIDIFLGRRR